LRFAAIGIDLRHQAGRRISSLDRDGTFAAFVKADGYETGRTAWVRRADGGFSEIVLKPDPGAQRAGDGRGKERSGRTR
jgi:hypothetical protein